MIKKTTRGNNIMIKKQSGISAALKSYANQEHRNITAADGGVLHPDPSVKPHLKCNGEGSVSRRTEASPRWLQTQKE